LFEYLSAFAQKVTDLPGVNDLEYKINLKPGTIQKRQRQYKYPPHLRAEIKKQLDQFESAGIIKRGEADWTHPIVLVKKNHYRKIRMNYQNIEYVWICVI